MDIIGHLAVIEHAGVSGGEVWADDAVLALFPNLAHCHEWAYHRLRASVERGAKVRDHTGELIEGHIITDWIIHYGSVLTPDPQRIGWAYQEMPWAVDNMDGFFDRALRNGLVDDDPRDHDTREHLERDFGHTSVECALDFWVGSEVADTQRERDLRASLRRLAEPSFNQSLVGQVFDSTGGYTREPDSLLSRTMLEYGQWAEQVVHPEDFAALTICTKYDWPYNRATIDYVLDFLHQVEKRLDRGRAERLLEDVVASIADPRRLVLAA
jgi:hypothetical protein